MHKVGNRCSITEQDREKILFSRIVFVLCMIFYTGFAIWDGPVWCRDSASYAGMEMSREPVYPLFLALFRRIFGESTILYDLPLYLFPAILTQSVLWSYAIWRSGMAAYNEICAAAGKKTGQAIQMHKFAAAGGILAVAVQLAVSLLNRFAAIRGSMYSECIMTESLAMPLFLLLCIRLYYWIKYHARKDLVISLIEAFLLISIRKQMGIGLILILAISCLYDVFRNKTRNIKRFLIISVSAVIVLSAANITDCTYNLVMRGVWTEHTGNSKAALCTLIFSSDEADKKLFDSYGTEDEKEIYSKIMDQCISQKLLISDVPENAGWQELAGHYADSYDIIGFDIVQPILRDYINENYSLNDTELELKMDEISNRIVKVLAHQDKADLLKVYAANVFKGFICSDARVMPVLNELGIAFYVVFLLMYAILFRRRKCRICLLAEIAFGGIIINSLIVGALIFPQPRYMIYSMGLFYEALVMEAFILLKDIHFKKDTEN